MSERIAFAEENPQEVFTLVRSVPFPEIETIRPDAFMFSRKGDQYFSVDEIFNIISHPKIQEHLGDDVTKYIITNQIKPKEDFPNPEIASTESRLFVTLNAHYSLPVDDNHIDWVVMYHHPEVQNQYTLPSSDIATRTAAMSEGNHIPTDGWQRVVYRDFLDTCIEIYRSHECNYCPKRGRRCLLEYLNYVDPDFFKTTDEIESLEDFEPAIKKARVYPFDRMPCTRSDASALFCRQTEEGDLTARDQFIHDHSFLLENPNEKNNDNNKKITDRIVESLKNSEICGYRFVDPANTLPQEVLNQHLMYRLRPPRFVVFEGCKPIDQDSG